MDNELYKEIKEYILLDPSILLNEKRIEGIILDSGNIEKSKIFVTMLPYKFGILKFLLNKNFDDISKNYLYQKIFSRYGIERNFLYDIFAIWEEIFNDELRIDLAKKIFDSNFNILELNNIKSLFDEEKLSLTKLAKKNNIKRDNLLNLFISKGLILDIRTITEKGLEQGIEYRYNDEGKKWPVYGIEAQNIIDICAKSCYLKHFRYFTDEGDYRRFPWWDTFCIEEIEEKDIEIMQFYVKCFDINTFPGKMISFAENIKYKLKIYYENHVLSFYTDAENFRIPDSDYIFFDEENDEDGNVAFFKGFTSLKYIKGIENIDISSNCDLSELFMSCYNLEELNLSKWDTSNVKNMSFMFSWCENLNKIDVSNWNTRNIEELICTFLYCTSLLTIDVSNWDVNNVTTMAEMFKECKNLIELNVSNWNIGSVTDMDSMFESCVSLSAIDISQWNVKNVRSMKCIFQRCESLEIIDVSSWDVSNLVDVSYMFDGCWNLEAVDISNWKINNVKRSECFYDGLDLREIYWSWGGEYAMNNDESNFYEDDEEYNSEEDSKNDAEFDEKEVSNKNVDLKKFFTNKDNPYIDKNKKNS